MTPASGSAKPVVRRRLRQARRARDGAAASLVAERLASHTDDLLRLAGPRDDGRPLVVAAYASLPGEPGTDLLRSRLRTLGHRVLLPVLLPDLDLDWAEDTSGARAGPHPVDPLRPPGPRLGPDALAGCDLVLVPALAVDLAGTRLGQGGGSYDRALPRLGAGGTAEGSAAGTAGTGRAPVLAVVHAEELLTDVALPRQPHDVGVDGVLTEGGVRLLARA